MSKRLLAGLLVSALLLPGSASVAQQARPKLWFGGLVSTPREREIQAKVMERLRVAFDLQTGDDNLPPIGVRVDMYSANDQTSTATVLIAPRPPVSLFRHMAVGSCRGTTTACADMIVDSIYKMAPTWYNVPGY